MKNFARLIQECDEWIRSGQLARCAAALQKIKSARVPSNYRRELAVIARRIGQPQMGLKLLTPMFGAGFEQARPADLAEYAVLLQRCGANREAMNLLSKVNEAHVPEASLYRAFAHFNLWEYEKAIPHLVHYLGSDISAYARLVGRVNLADAFLFTERYDAAEFLLEELAAELRPLKLNRLLGNCYEMLGQLHIIRGNLSRAEDLLSRAEAILGQTAALDRFYVSRWQSILQSFKQNDVAPLMAFREQAVRKGEFESIRQTDYFRLKVSFDTDVFRGLYFGTPYPAYREKMARAFGGEPRAETYVWGPTKGSLLNVREARVNGRELEIKGLKSHALLVALSEDFYRPIRTTEIFAALWPNEHFNVFSSPQRVHQVVARTRRYFMQQCLDLKIAQSPAGYKIDFGKKTALEISSIQAPAIKYERLLHDLKHSSPQGFTKRSAVAELGISASAFRRFCSWAVQDGRIQKFGASTNTRYIYSSLS
jgi:tetratricopeptide (TPR) repeat protein